MEGLPEEALFWKGAGELKHQSFVALPGALSSVNMQWLWSTPLCTSPIVTPVPMSSDAIPREDSDEKVQRMTWGKQIIAPVSPTDVMEGCVAVSSLNAKSCVCVMITDVFSNHSEQTMCCYEAIILKLSNYQNIYVISQCNNMDLCGTLARPSQTWTIQLEILTALEI